MGSSISREQQGNFGGGNANINDGFQTLSTLLREEPVPWNDVRQSLLEEPEQACMYAHGLEASQLFVALSKGGCPLDVVRTLLEADEDAMDSTFEGHTVLHAAVMTTARRNDNSEIAEAAAAAAAAEAVEVVLLLLSQRGRLARTPNRQGLLPLHLCRSVEVAEVLLETYPEAVGQRSRCSGSLALHHAVAEDEPNPDLCQFLVQKTQKLAPSLAAGGLLTRNKHGKTPLSLLIDHLDDDMLAITNRNKMWAVLRLSYLPVLMANATVTRDLELHTLVDYRCCHSFHLMEMALEDFAHQTTLRDTLGRTPLHVAVSHTGTCRCSYQALKCLIRANPKAPRMGDNDGRLPIDWAAECPHISNRNLALLMKGEPRAIDTRDLRDGHYPFVSAALKQNPNSINNTYALLRAKPHVLSYFHTP